MIMGRLAQAAARTSTGIATMPPSARARGFWRGVGLWSWIQVVREAVGPEVVPQQ